MARPRQHPISDDERATIGQRLRTHREASDLTLATVSAAVGCSIGHLANVERGRRRLSDDLAARLATVYRIKIEDVAA